MGVGQGKGRWLTVEVRFWNQTSKYGKYHPRLGRCWHWTGTISGGYGRISRKGEDTGAHRISWEIHYGDVPDGHDVLHKCDNPICVNPKHLFTGTAKDNVQDMISKGRKNPAKGESNGLAKLTAEDVAYIRKNYRPRKGVSKLAGMFGITKTNLGFIVRRETWKHVP